MQDLIKSFSQEFFKNMILLTQSTFRKIVKVFSFFRFTSSHPEMLCKKGFLRNFPNFKKETLTQVFSCEFCEICKNTFSYRTLPVAALHPFDLFQLIIVKTKT